MKITDNKDNTVFATLGKVCKALNVSTLPLLPENLRKSLILSKLNCFNCFSAFQSCFESAFVVSFPGREAGKDFQKRKFCASKNDVLLPQHVTVSLVGNPRERLAFYRRKTTIKQ